MVKTRFLKFVLGVYEKDGEVTTYLATVPEPSTRAMLALGAGLVLWRIRSMRRDA